MAAAGTGDDRDDRPEGEEPSRTPAAEPADAREPTAGDAAEAADAEERDGAGASRDRDGETAAPRGHGDAHGLRRKRRTSATIAVLLALLGFAAAVQLRNHREDPELAGARQEDLVRILADLDERQKRLSDEIASLQESKRQLTSGAEGGEAALDEARGLADELGILAGTLPAKGPGLVLEFHSGAEPIRAATILDAVEELRGAGMEAAQIAGENGAVVRIVASTYFVAGDGGLIVDGATLTGTYTITVIGDPATMDTALRIPGGVVDNVGQDGGTVVVNEPGEVHVSATVAPTEPKYAEPA